MESVMANTPQSRKAKGRRFQQEIRDLLLESFPQLESDDIRSTGMGQSGEDLLLSPMARKSIPFAIEAKNQERINIWQALQQAEANAGKHKPLLCFKKNRSKSYVVLEINDFIELLKK